MAFDANETLWTPGRPHAGNELETEFNNGVAALDPAVGTGVRVADFDPNAALPPWVFAQSRSRGAVHLKWQGFDTVNDGLPAGTNVVDAQWLHRRLGLIVTRWVVTTFDPFGTPFTVRARLLYRTRDSATSIVIAEVNVTEAVGLAEAAVASVAVPAGAALQMELRQTAGVAGRFITIMGTVLVSRRWVASEV